MSNFEYANATEAQLIAWEQEAYLQERLDREYYQLEREFLDELYGR